MGIDALTVESERADEFQVTYELPYGKDCIFYCQAEDSPIAPRCAIVG